jgi:hypothetical protein
VLDDFGRLGRACRETDEHATDHETLIRYLVNGEFNNPVRIVFSIKGWCRYVTMDVADELTAGSVLQFWTALIGASDRPEQGPETNGRMMSGWTSNRASSAAPWPQGALMSDRIRVGERGQ